MVCAMNDYEHLSKRYYICFLSMATNGCYLSVISQSSLLNTHLLKHAKYILDVYQLFRNLSLK